ncbi:MAG: hypothetical protein IKI50_07835 [Clostridia bacterium]|nr:hypothetical protein [Clostridia bacterium]
MILVTDAKTAFRLKQPSLKIYDTARLPEQWKEIRELLDKGESLFFLGTENIDQLKDIWVFSAPADNAGCRAVLEEEGTGLSTACPFTLQATRNLYVRPTGTYAMHGVDDEPRMDIVPLLQTYGALHNLKGTPALLLRHWAPSLTGGHFAGAFWYIFAVEDPCAALPAEQWDALIEQADAYARRPIFISYLQPEYALYREQEQAVIRFRVMNRSAEPVAYTAELDAYDEQGQLLAHVATKECIATGGDTVADVCRWTLPAGLPNGAVKLRMELRERDRMVYGVKRETEYKTADVMYTGFLAHTGPLSGPVIEVKDGRLYIDGQTDFFLGTTLYPSADFYELSFRPVHVLKLVRGVRAMQEAGVRLCRIWCDPILDEESIRGMETVIRVFALYGIAVNFMFFSSWVHYMEIHADGHDLRFEVASMENERLIGFYMHQIAEQKLFVTTLVKHWNDLRNILWDFSNEFSIVDPKPDQLDEPWLLDDYKTMEKPYDNIRLFEQWALQIREAIRACGNRQPVVFGVSCWDTGSENYRCSKQADLIANHGYYPIDMLPPYLFNSASACLHKPQFMEEFGGTWPDNVERAKDFDMRYHYFLGAGEDAAVNYEWGVLWLCDQLPGTPPYLKMQAHIEEKDLQDFLFMGRYTYGKSWPLGSTGICPWMASFEYGNIYGCMNYPSPTTAVMRRTADLGKGMGRVVRDKAVYLVLPFETKPFTPLFGYPRYMDVISKTVNLLLQNGVDFLTWQEDELASLPASARVVLYPNQLPIRPDKQRLLDALKAKGTAVYTGGDEAFLQDPALVRLPFTCADNTNVLLRDVDGGQMAVIVHPAEASDPNAIGGYSNQTTTAARSAKGTVAFTAQKDGTEIAFDVCRSASFVWNDGLRQAEFSGALQVNGKELARFDAAGKTPFAKCLLRTPDGALLAQADTLLVFPYDAGVLTLAGVYTKAQVLDDHGDVLAELTPETTAAQTTLTLTSDCLMYQVRLSR